MTIPVDDNSLVCAMCYDSESNLESPNGYHTECFHFFCSNCIHEMRNNTLEQCPFCDSDISRWVYAVEENTYSDSDSSD
jgi:hypothetical protein